MRTHAEMLDRLSRILRSPQQHNIAAGRMLHGQLIQSQALTTSLFDPRAGGGGESESRDVQLGYNKETVVICDGADDGDGLVGVGLLCGLGGDFGGDTGDGHRRAVDAGHEEASEDDFVEVGVSSACKEAVKLHE